MKPTHHVHHYHPIAAVAAVAAGLLLAVQSRVTGEMARVVGDGVLAAFISFGTGFALLALVVVFRPASRANLVRVLPVEVRAGRIRWWYFTAGLCGAIYVLSQALAVPLLGVALFTVVVVSGTTGVSLLVDRVGLGPGGRRAVTHRRLVGAVGTTLAVAVAVSGRFVQGEIALWALVLAVVAGMLLGVAPALNGLIVARIGDPFVTSATSFGAGAFALLVALIVEHRIFGHGWVAPPTPWHSPLLWISGLLGASVVVCSVLVIKALGALLFSLLLIAGQLVGSLVCDLVAPPAGVEVGWHLVSGVVLAAIAVAFAARRR
ncbi:unannotated protein [freshwater metagenome]|uniref:Unannotated protein n=1 Tax=freshwater metagenome TaxID=449393 RepID=A0A6J7BYG6_9ZZZZ|nr:EamA-like transporter family protein [Actinomycetota bacterium]MSW36246.1 EamA-like transporter family protein [Actinomycetota bacterium]MSX38631.1 EamA-like transporter family protein [Actinomycetota bacterium]